MSGLPEKRPTPADDQSATPWRAILGAFAALYAIVFVVLNTDQVEISFVFFKAETSLLVLILLSMGLGAVIALFGPAYWRRRQRMRKLDPDRRP
jgi:uncharacterized integral membrane protein